MCCQAYAHMIERTEGCYHMTCKCGRQFCYVCGASYVGNEQGRECNLFGVPAEEQHPEVQPAGVAHMVSAGL